MNKLRLELSLRSGKLIIIIFDAIDEDVVLTKAEWADLFWKVIAADDFLYVDDINGDPHVFHPNAVDYFTIKEF